MSTADVDMHHKQSEGLKVVGNLFKPQNFEEGDALLPAILVAGAMTGVLANMRKELAKMVM